MVHLNWVLDTISVHFLALGIANLPVDISGTVYCYVGLW